MEEKEVLIKVEGLSKKFCKDLKTSLKYGVQDLFTNFGKNNKEAILREKEFWAVKDINFELRRGECLGLIGHNGAGKSTLLKILNGLINPDEGKVTIKGKVSALIELGAGFNPILSGRENIYNNGAVLGFTREQINNKIEEIIDFAEIREFIDMPVQNYSSGMKVRLGFAVAAQMEPDVLIIDEVLAVGDLGFVLKCLKTIDTLLPTTAIVFVSHSMPMVSRVCNQIILMERGVTHFRGNNIGKAIDMYYGRFTNNERKIIFDDDSLILEIAEIIYVDVIRNNLKQIAWNEDIKIHLKFKLRTLIEIPVFIISIFDKEQREVAVFKYNNSKSNLAIIDEHIEFILSHKSLQLSKGIYSLNISVATMRTKAPILRINNLLTFQIIYPDEVWPSFMLSSNYENYKY